MRGGGEKDYKQEVEEIKITREQKEKEEQVEIYEEEEEGEEEVVKENKGDKEKEVRMWLGEEGE